MGRKGFTGRAEWIISCFVDVPVIADNGGPYLYDKVTRTFLQGATSGLWDVGEKGERYAQGLSIILR